MDGKNQLNRIKWLMDQMQQEAGDNLTDFARPATAGQVYALAGAVRGLAQAVLGSIETERSDSERTENEEVKELVDEMIKLQARIDLKPEFERLNEERKSGKAPDCPMCGEPMLATGTTEGAYVCGCGTYERTG